jgi:hypothetical protein
MIEVDGAARIEPMYRREPMYHRYREIQRRLFRAFVPRPQLVTVVSIAFCVAAVGMAVVGSGRRGVATSVAVVLVLIGAALSVLGLWVARPRGLAAGQRRTLLRTLGRLTPLEVRVSAIDEGEAIHYARELRNVMTEAQWPVTGVFKSPDGGNGTGVTLAVRNVVTPPVEAIALMNTLRRVGVPATWEHKPELAGDRTIEVLVGRRR